MLEESEEEEDGLSVSMSVLGPGGDERSIKVTNKGQSMGGDQSTRRRVLIDGDQFGDESFYIEEIIEESEEETDEDDILRSQTNQGSRFSSMK